MASSIASTSHSRHHHHHHHQAQHVSRPTASNATRTASSSSFSSLGPGPAPDLTERFKLKAKYLDLQRDYFRALEIRKDLTIEVKEKQDKLQSLQDEVDLLIDQIFDSDYARLEPSDDDLFSTPEDEDEDPDRTAKDNHPRTAPSLEPSTSSAPPTGGHHGVIRKDPPRTDSGDVDEAGPSAKRARVEEPGPHEEAAFPNGRRLEE
ncbi:hypothetical protein MVLG_00415 [Microbotryum lychnidis-dioicae p1A1 Lamole]|uniref:Uncharacterized protein n=1 Tax=Microbotryum lychnidis-dioicae (strain p1A1 Lamole / MvSl-1064) TaxID=683840 RepID=U5GZ08_USTV1|nr:hypothetical protein MVLG_00415 [Microbotryum lychnidis-dioicae p1A1 Lamole]|eukprot:KDE09517.1 hypothetical protein MVLG_00415 [Microbotryum lychnidis-dioicae p1A1 Lamole]